MTLKNFFATLTLLCIVISNNVFAANSDKRLFVNLTSDELNRATMAIVFSTRVLTEQRIPVTISLSVEGVRIADKNIPESRNADGNSLKELLSGFIEKGGRVYICAMCMENVGGIKEDELIDGVQIGGGMTALFEEGTIALSF